MVGALSAGRAPRPVVRPPEAPSGGSCITPGLRAAKGGVVKTVDGVGRPGDRGISGRAGSISSWDAGLGCLCRWASSTWTDWRQCVLTAPPSRPGDNARTSAQGQWRIGWHPIRPVLKHGPRSLTCARVTGCYETQGRSESERRWDPGPLEGWAHHRPVWSPPPRGQAEQERTRWDPKDGELCLSRLRPGETLVEGRSDSDVQIDRPT